MVMGIPPSEARALSLWEYEVLLDGWNKSQSRDGEDDDLPLAVDRATAKAHIDRINADPRLTGKAPAA